MSNLKTPHACRKQTITESKQLAQGPSSPRLKVVLLVDDVDDIRVTTKWFLNTCGYAVDSARSAEEALAIFDPKIHDVVVTDNAMLGMTGAEMGHIIKLRSPSTPVIMYTAVPPDDQSCIDLVIRRPAHMLSVKEAVDKLLAEKSS